MVNLQNFIIRSLSMKKLPRKLHNIEADTMDVLNNPIFRKMSKLNSKLFKTKMQVFIITLKHSFIFNINVFYSKLYFAF